MAGKQLKMTFPPGKWRPVKTLLERYSKHLSHSAAAKLIIQELADIIDENPDFWPREALQALSELKGKKQGPIRTFSSRRVPPARDPDPDQRVSINTPSPPPERARTHEAPASSFQAGNDCDVAAFVAELHDTLNREAGTSYPAYDPGAERVLLQRLGRVPGCAGAPATPEQVRAVVAHYAREWGGTQWARGLHLRGLLGERFWERAGAMSAPVAKERPKGKAANAEYLAKLRGELRQQDRRHERESERADESQARARGLVVDLAERKKVK